jgi:hypothetical protein
MSKVEKPATCWVGDGVVDVDFAAMVKTRRDSWCARRSWRDPAGESPVQVRSSARASVASWEVTTTAKRTQ